MVETVGRITQLSNAPGLPTVPAAATNIETEVKALEPLVRDAQALAVRDQGTRNNALSFLAAVKQAQNRIFDLCDPTVAKALAAHREAVAMRKRMLAPFELAEAAVKHKVLAYDQEAERARRAEQARLQAEADARAEAERKRALAAAAKLKTPELREARIEAAQEITAPVVQVAPAVSKAHGESSRVTWRAELVSLPDLIKTAAGGSQAAVSLLAFDSVAANAFARGTKGAVQIPGVRVYSETGMSLRV
jgi:hypothetical protein